MEEVQNQTALGDWKKFDPRYRAVADYFGVEPNREWSQYADKVDYFYNWAKKTSGSEEIPALLKTLDKLEKKCPPPAWNERRIQSMFRTLRLNNDSMKVERQQVQANAKKIEEKVVDRITESVVGEMKGLKTQVKSLQNQLKEKEAAKAPEATAPVEEPTYVDYTSGW